MDSVEEEDVSARVLLRNVLHTETQRSPVTRSVSRDQQLSRVRRSSRLRNPSETPQLALHHKLKQKLHETATRSPLPPSKRARTPGRSLETPAVLLSPALYDDDVTPRGLLRGIIRTETEASLLLSGQTALPQGDQRDAEASIHGNRRSDGVSALELPDLVTEPLTHVIRGMSRRRPPPTFNVSAFEKHLEQASGDEEGMDVSQENPDVSKEQDLSAGSKSILSLTLKTPFVNLRSERAGLRRKAAGRRAQVSVDAFDEAIQKRLERHQNQDYTLVQDGRTLQDADWQKFTLGLSNVTVPELTTDVLMSDTELYAHPQASKSELSGVDGRLAECDVTANDDGDNDADVREELQDVGQDQVNMSEASKPHRSPAEDSDLDSQRSQEEEDEVEMILPSQERRGVSLSPEDIPFAPTQTMVDRATQSQEQEVGVSGAQEAKVEEMDWREGESLQEEELSHGPQQITYRAYHSEGGAISRDVMARGKATRSLGVGHDPTEKQEQSSGELQSFAGGTVNMEEEAHRSPTSSSAVRTTKPLSSETHQETSLQTADEEDAVQDHGRSGSEDVVSVHVSPTVDFPYEEEEQGQQEEEEEEEQLGQQEEEEEEQLGQQEEEEQQLGQQEEEEQQLGQQEEEEEEEEQQQEEEEEQLGQQEEEEEEEEEQLQEEEEEEDEQSEELSMQTPGFIRQRKQVSTPGALATPTVLKALNAGPSPKVVKPRPKRKPQRESVGVLPKSYVMSVFKHFAKTKVASDVYPVISDILQRYFDRLADDLEAYSAHAKRKTIEVEDVELLMRRQGFVTDSTPVNVLIEKFLPLEYRKLLIPVATSGNKVMPDRRR